MNKIVILTLTAALNVCAQPAQSPAFEVASVKPHVQGSGYISGSCSNGRYRASGFPLVYIIEWAYVTETQCRLMMQALLAERFKFASHWETKEAQVSDLVVAKGGPKLQKAAETDEGPDVKITLNGAPIIGPRTGQPKGFTIQELATFLTSGVRLQPISDKTGLEGRYKVDLKFSIQPAGSTQVLEDPDLDTALQQQLGLKLERHKGSVKLLIVDRLERPDSN